MTEILLVGEMIDPGRVTQIEADERWKITVAHSDDAVMTHLAGKAFDLVAVDISSSAMNGIDLLLEIKKHYPDVIRIALFSAPELDAELEQLQAAHQSVLKPVTLEGLVGVIHRRLDMKIMLDCLQLKKAVDSLHKLPSLPNLYQKILAEAASKNSSLIKISNIVAQDVAMTAKILQLVNSAFFGLQSRVSSVAQAVNLLGLDTIKGLVLQVHLFDGEFALKMKKNQLRNLTLHSQQVGGLARKIAELEGMSDKCCAIAMLSGVLHDVGNLAFAVSYPDLYEASPGGANCLLSERQAWERQTFGATHAEAGAYLMAHWGLPGELVEAIAYHHCPGHSRAPELSPLTAVHIATVLVVEASQAENVAGQSIELDRQYLETLGIAGHEAAWRKVSEEMLDKATPPVN